MKLLVILIFLSLQSNADMPIENDGDFETRQSLMETEHAPEYPAPPDSPRWSPREDYEWRDKYPRIDLNEFYRTRDGSVYRRDTGESANGEFTVYPARIINAEKIIRNSKILKEDMEIYFNRDEDNLRYERPNPDYISYRLREEMNHEKTEKDRTIPLMMFSFGNQGEFTYKESSLVIGNQLSNEEAIHVIDGKIQELTIMKEILEQAQEGHKKGGNQTVWIHYE